MPTLHADDAANAALSISTIASGWLRLSANIGKDVRESGLSSQEPFAVSDRSNLGSRHMNKLREYRKIKYMGDCKCGKCQLIPLEVIDDQILYIDRLADLVKTLIENDPDEPIADNGATVLDLWRDRAKRALAETIC